MLGNPSRFQLLNVTCFTRVWKREWKIKGQQIVVGSRGSRENCEVGTKLLLSYPSDES